MPQIVNTNIASLNTQRNLNSSQMAQSTAIQRLSTGLRINSAKDDAAGLAIAERMSTQIRGLSVAARNAQDAISLSQTADSALGSMTENLQRIRELAVQAANGTNSAADRAALDAEVQQRIAEVDRIAGTSAFNGVKLLDGSFGSSTFQIGANSGESIGLSLSSSMRAAAIGSYVNQAGQVTGNTTTAAVTNFAYNGTTTSNGVASAAAGTYAGVNSTALAASQLKINGVDIGAAVAGAATGQGTDSAYAKAAAVNAAGVSGVSATANTAVVYSAASGGVAGTSDFLKSPATGTFAYTLTINGQNVLSATGDTSIDTAVSNINKWSSTTGVVATKDTGGGLKLEAADGRNIQMSQAFTMSGVTDGNTIATAIGTATAASNAAVTQATTVRGAITLASTANVAFAGAGSPALIGFSGTGVTATSNVAAVDVKTAAGANNAMLAVDSALNAISGLRSTFGALQNRFEATISNLQSASENATAARSRVQDTDYAEETSKLTRSQILQQAGVAMLAQANALPQNVLSLLKG